MAVMKLMKCGPRGTRGMQEYLHHSGLDNFVASSEGAIQDVNARSRSPNARWTLAGRIKTRVDEER
jgi:hypothetical protein